MIEESLILADMQKQFKLIVKPKAERQSYHLHFIVRDITGAGNQIFKKVIYRSADTFL